MQRLFDSNFLHTLPSVHPSRPPDPSETISGRLDKVLLPYEKGNLIPPLISRVFLRAKLDLQRISGWCFSQLKVSCMPSSLMSVYDGKIPCTYLKSSASRSLFLHLFISLSRVKTIMTELVKRTYN